MEYSLIWLPAALKEAGLKVALVPGWESRGRGDVSRIVGVICHHTAGARQGNMPSLKTLIDGRHDLPGPLSQLGLGRDGTFYVIAAGKCNHAGAGIWKGFVNGNSNFIGIEAENTGTSNDFPWPHVQMEAYKRGVAAILKHIGQSEEFCAAHKEYALPKGRKPDTNFNITNFRSDIAKILNGTTPPLVPIPALEPVKSRPTLRRNASGELVKGIQRKLKIEADGVFGPGTEAAIRAFQRGKNLVPDGIVGPKTWQALDEVA